MKFLQKHGNVIITISLVVCIGGLGIYNVINNKLFLKVSASSLLTMFIAVIVSFWLVQLKNDKRKLNDKIDKLVYKIQDIISSSDFTSCETADICRKNLILHRSVANKIEYLKSVCEKDDNIKSSILEIENEFRALREFYSDHYMDEEYMRKSQKEFQNYITKIDDEADKIHVKLF